MTIFTAQETFFLNCDFERVILTNTKQEFFHHKLKNISCPDERPQQMRGSAPTERVRISAETSCPHYSAMSTITAIAKAATIIT